MKEQILTRLEYENLETKLRKELEETTVLTDDGFMPFGYEHACTAANTAMSFMITNDLIYIIEDRKPKK